MCNWLMWTKVYTGEEPALQAQALSHAIRLEVVKLSEAKKGFVLQPKRWVVKRSFGWAARFKRISRDYERLASTLTGMHWLASRPSCPHLYSIKVNNRL